MRKKRNQGGIETRQEERMCCRSLLPCQARCAAWNQQLEKETKHTSRRNHILSATQYLPCAVAYWNADQTAWRCNLQPKSRGQQTHTRNQTRKNHAWRKLRASKIVSKKQTPRHNMSLKEQRASNHDSKKSCPVSDTTSAQRPNLLCNHETFYLLDIAEISPQEKSVQRKFSICF